MAQTPPLPAHIPPPSETGEAEGDGDAVRVQPDSASESSTTQGGLPRRQVTPPEERPSSMAAAAQALAGNRSPGATPQTPASEQDAPRQPGLAPPVIPGAAGAGRGTTPPIVPAPAARPTIPPTRPDSAGQSPASRPDPAGGQSPASRPDPAGGQSPAARPGSGGQSPATRPDAAGPSPVSRAELAGQSSTTRPEPADQSQMSQPESAGQPQATRSEPGGQPQTRPGGQPQAARSEPLPAIPDEDDFVPANEVERDLYHAVDEGSTDAFLSTLLLATVHVPVADNSRPGSAPGESGFAFRTEEFDGEVFLVVFTSRDRLGEHFAEPTRTVGVRFVDLIRNWPDPAWSFAVNPTSPIGAKYPGPQVIALATWAVEAGLGGDPVDAPAEQPQRPAEPTAQLTVMQKAVPAEQIDYYLERGYDRVAGFVHRAGEVEHLRSPGELFAALGLLYDGSPYQGDAKEAFVLRWAAHRPSLYRIPYGGQSEQALRAMDGWVIERPPFRGNGFAPGEGKDVIAEFKVDSVRLPHGAQLWRMDADGHDQMIAVFDCDAPVWRRVGEQ
jgi:type III secretion system (T3SS) SseB-like protein